MLHDAQFSCLFLSWVCVSVFLLSLVEYGVFWGASSADILALPGPVFVYLGMGAKVWLQMGCIRVRMTLEVLGVADIFGGVVCLGFCLVCLCCPRGFGINVSGGLWGLWDLCSSVGGEFLMLSRFVLS